MYNQSVSCFRDKVSIKSIKYGVKPEYVCGWLSMRNGILTTIQKIY